MTMWLPELIGGIWPDDDLTQRYIRNSFSATEDPNGQVTCEACPARFPNLRNLTLHRRQTHNIYLPTDAKVVMSKPATGHSQRLINLAQQTSRIQIARMNAPSGAIPQNVAPHGALMETPDSTANFSMMGSSEALPMGMRPAINRQLHEPEYRGFASAPHPAWRPVLEANAVASPRVPKACPVAQHPRNHTPPFARSKLPPSSLGRTGLSHAEVAGQASAQREALAGRQQGPPVDAIRGILTRNREGVRGVGVPVQGMLHSLEQGGGAEGAWPRPPGGEVP
jgi:hypothetical protein